MYVCNIHFLIKILKYYVFISPANIFKNFCLMAFFKKTSVFVKYIPDSVASIASINKLDIKSTGD